MHANTPAVENDSVGCSDLFNRLPIPGGAQTGDGAQLGLISHPVSADELSAFGADDPIKRLSEFQAVDHAFERKVGRHDEWVERLLRFGPELLEVYLVRFRTGCVFVAFVDGLGLRLPHPAAHFVAFEFYRMVSMQFMLPLFLRCESQIVRGGLAFPRLGDTPAPAARRFYLPGGTLELNVNVHRDGERCRRQHCAGAHLDRGLYDVADGLRGASEFRP